MFYKARLKLTAWYLLIIMLISISFSLVVYHALTFEFNRILRIERLRQERALPSPIPSLTFPLKDDTQRRGRLNIPSPEIIKEAKNRLISILALVNLGILFFSGAAGYFLAGKTLKPIKEMVDEQNRFITDASHELRTPLTSLKSEIEVNLRDKKMDISQAKKLLESNLEEVNNLQYLSDNLIKLSQFKRDNDIQFEEVNLKELILEAQKKVAILAKKRNITIKNSLSDQKVWANKQSLAELFVILLDNAIKYSHKDKQVSISSNVDSGKLAVLIKDQGIGISKHDLSHLFDRFYRVDSSRTKINVPGYGLGLSIAIQILEKHHGSVSVESTLGIGSTFKILLPLSY